MEFLYDVWVNWFEGEENGYNVPEFHEWRKHDHIELLDCTPLIKVTKDFFTYIEYGLGKMPEQLLADVENKTYIRRNNERQKIKYCFAATDGERIIIVDTLSYDIPMKKSRTTHRQEHVIFSKASVMEVSEYEYEKYEKEYHILSPHPDLMIGLTRRERQLKQLLLMALDELYNSKDENKMRYWYIEWFPNEYINSQGLTYDGMFVEIYGDVCNGWSKKHEEYCETMIKGRPYYEKLWELENIKAK